MVYMVGGAVDVPGNVGISHAGIDNSVADWNIYVDPRAAAIVLQSGVSVTLVPLDATNHVPVTMNFLERLEDDRITPEASFIFDVFQKLNTTILFGLEGIIFGIHLQLRS